jgi:hypothetical protein
MSQLIGFYLGEQTNSDGRTLEEIWRMSKVELMHSDDVIQWLFPLDRQSAFNPDAPILTSNEIVFFRLSPQLRENTLTSFHRFLFVLGLLLEDGSVQEITDVGLWAGPNHNWLRITRTLESSSLLGHEEEAKALLRYCEAKATPAAVEMSLPYWKQAIRNVVEEEQS